MLKSLMSLVLAVTLLTSVAPFAFSQEAAPLTNGDILTMVRAKLPSALIIEKIKNSSCAFDTFPSVLAELKYKGVPDDVLMVMVESPHGGRATRKTQASAEKTPELPTQLMDLTIPDGTILEVECTYTVSSGDVEEGNAVSFNVVHPVVINGVTVIAKGARATARVTKAKKGGSWAGRVNWPGRCRMSSP